MMLSNKLRLLLNVKKKNTTVPIASKRSFSRNHQLDKAIELKCQSVTQVYRGIAANHKFSLFHPASIIVGLPSRKAYHQDKRVSAIDIVRHKDSPARENENYYVGASADEGIASTFGQLLITIDSTHPQDWVDVDYTFYKVCEYAFKYIEEEKATLAILLAAVKSILDKTTKQTFENPFYLSIDENNPQIISKYQQVYASYCEVLANTSPALSGNNKIELFAAIKKYTKHLIELYSATRGENNPFNLTLPQFAKQFPNFAKEMASYNHPSFTTKKFFSSPCSNKLEKLSEIMLRQSPSLYMSHQYTPKKP